MHGAGGARQTARRSRQLWMFPVASSWLSARFVAERARAVQWWETTLQHRVASGALEHLGEGVEEADVLLGQPVGDAQRGRLATERGAAPHEHAALAQPRHHLHLVAVLAEPD